MAKRTDALRGYLADSVRRLSSECRSLGQAGPDEALRDAGVTRKIILGIADEMRVGLRGTARRVCGLRGVKVRRRVQTVYEWMHLNCVWWPAGEGD